jgi:hypothetical protein
MRVLFDLRCIFIRARVDQTRSARTSRIFPSRRRLLSYILKKFFTVSTHFLRQTNCVQISWNSSSVKTIQIGFRHVEIFCFRLRLNPQFVKSGDGIKRTVRDTLMYFYMPCIFNCYFYNDIDTCRVTLRVE